MSQVEKNSKAIFYNKLSQLMNQQYGHTFGESVSIDPAMKDTLAKSASRLLFDNDIKRAAGESGIATNSGVIQEYKKSLVQGMQQEYEARARRALSESAFIPSQQWSIWGSNMVTTNQQLMLHALAPAVIKPIHNKIVKPIVVKGVDYRREAVDTIVVDSKGRQFNFYDLMNDPAKWAEVSTGGQPTIYVEVPIANGTIKDPKVNGNLCQLYNRTAQSTLGFRAIKSMHDFIAKGVEIVELIIDGKKYPASYVSAGQQVQSGEQSLLVASITYKFDFEGSEINILGRVNADGEVILASDDGINAANGFDQAKKKVVTGVKFKFFVPSKGAQEALKTQDFVTSFVKRIEQKTAFRTSLNQDLINTTEFVMNKDIANRFGETSVELTNAKKDQALMEYVDRLSAELLVEETNINKVENKEVYSNFRKKLAREYVDMTVTNAGFTDVLTAGNMSLARAMYSVCNSLDVTFNPDKKSFSMYSSSSSAQWIKTSAKGDVIELNIIGDVVKGGDSIGGVELGPYSLQKVNIGGLYDATFITTNKVVSEQVEKEVTDAAGTKRKVLTKHHKFTLIPQFEEKMDSILFLHGPEYITEGVFDTEYNLDKTLQYETKFDIVKYLPALGVIDFVEEPMTVKKVK